jgi:hypothetical protein
MNRRIPLNGRAIEHLSSDFEPWLSCNDCFDQVDEVIDDFAYRRVPIGGAFQAHLRGCPACMEEARVLLAVVAEEGALDLNGLLSQFDELVDAR